MGKTVTQRKRELLNVFDRHQLSIAFKTLNLTDEGARIMGGMTKDEAKVIILKLTGRTV